MNGPERRARFEEIYQAYSGLILAYALRRGAGAEDAGDVVAETFATAWRRIDDVPPGEQARPWLYGVARRVCANQRRGRERRARLDQRIAADLGPLVAAAAVSAEGPGLEHIAAVFARLPEGDREVLALVGWEGLDRDEIAVVLGCSRATVRVRLHRARTRFARGLAEAGAARPEPQRLAPAGHEPATAAPHRMPPHTDAEAAR